MTITTVDGALAGMQPGRFFYKFYPVNLAPNRWHSSWLTNGIPGPGAEDTTLNGVTLSSTSALVAGQLPFYDPGGGSKSYLSRLVVDGYNNMGPAYLCDRLWHNGGYTITSNTAQNSTTPTWPARDIAGSTNGDGVILGVEVSSTVGAAAPNVTVVYTNSAGTTTRSGTAVGISGAASPSFFPVPLQAGDTGVKSVQSLTLSTSWVSGTINLVAYRVIACLPIFLSSASLDIMSSGMPQMFDGTVPFLLTVPTTSTASYLSGLLAVTQG